LELANNKEIAYEQVSVQGTLGYGFDQYEKERLV
jgi:hypothetical protein